MDERVKKLGILITSHPKQQKFWQHGLGSWEGCPFYKLMGYDDENLNEVPLETIMPPVDETFATGYKKGHIGHFRGELEQMKKGGLILKEKGFEYIYKTAADTTCWKWRKLADMFKVLGKYDFVMCGTAIIFGRLDAFNECMKLWHPKLKSGGAELYFGSQIRALGIKALPQKPPWWENTLGRIHTQGEYAVNNEMTVTKTWVKGHIYGDDYRHRDIIKGRDIP